MVADCHHVASAAEIIGIGLRCLWREVHRFQFDVDAESAAIAHFVGAAFNVKDIDAVGGILHSGAGI